MTYVYYLALICLLKFLILLYFQALYFCVVKMAVVTLVCFKFCYYFSLVLLPTGEMCSNGDYDHHSDITVAQKSNARGGVFLSGSSDGGIKIWNKKCELIRETKISFPIKALTFYNNYCDVLVGLESTISIISFDKMISPNAEVHYATEQDFEKYQQFKHNATHKAKFTGIFIYLIYLYYS